MENFRNIGLIGRLGSGKVVDTLRRLKRFLLDGGYTVILEDAVADLLPGHQQQVCTRKMMGEICDLVIVVGGDGSLLGAARAAAFLERRDYCTPDDIKRLALPVLAHRVVVGSGYSSPHKRSREAEAILAEILESIDIPL